VPALILAKTGQPRGLPLRIMKGYQTSQWQAFRAEVIELDGGRCNVCQRLEADVVLQVHHKKYIPGRVPWQYTYADCETLCKGCHAAEHGKIPPKTGWQYLGYEDLGEVSANCELCGSNFRYQFFVYHKNWGSMQVGTVCCNALTGTELANNQVNKQNKYDERKRRFIDSKRWIKISGREIIRQKGIRVDIAEFEGKYRIQLDQYQGRKGFASIEEAKLHAFTIIEDGSAKEFLTRRGEIHHARPDRQSIRLKNYDYSQAGLYFITICTQHRRCLFGEINADVMVLNDLGHCVNQCWSELHEYYANSRLHEFVIMPNHFHGVIELINIAGAMNLAPTVGKIIRGFKARCTFLINKQFDLAGNKLWQRNYYEHVIRDEKSYIQILEYMQTNPQKWHEDGYFESY
jgi:REP element-mobilizing transposase RayT